MCSSHVVVAALVLFGVVGIKQGPAQVKDNSLTRGEGLETRLRAYHSLVETYHDGRSSSVEELGQWTESAITEVSAVLGSPMDRVSPWPTWRFRAATMLHTDVALKFLASKDRHRAYFHLDLAGLILSRAGPDLGSFASRWNEAAARTLRFNGAFSETLRFLESARRRWPKDPRILHESGIATELQGAAELRIEAALLDQATVPEGMATAPRLPSASRQSIRANRHQAQKHLREAESYLREASGIGSTDPLTPLHLARVLVLQHKEGDALTIIHDLLSQTQDRAVRYLANLMAGSVLERRGDLTEAIRHYRTAVAEMPAGQAAYVAVAAALFRTGRMEEARAVLRNYMSGTARGDAVREPWWTYVFDSEAAVMQLLGDLRSEAQQ
jgi:tetratricopeptide (TPR) repeat protein